MTKKVKMKKRVPKMSAWAVVGEKTMSPWGNGYEFQYPIFHTRIEAQEWFKRLGVRHNTDDKYRIVPVRIIELHSQKKKR